MVYDIIRFGDEARRWVRIHQCVFVTDSFYLIRVGAFFMRENCVMNLSILVESA